MTWPKAQAQDALPPARPSQVPAPAAAPLAPDLLARWLALSDLEASAGAAMIHELQLSSTDVEQSALDLSRRFHDLAENAVAQAARVERVTAAARTVAVGEREVSLEEATGLIESALTKVIDTVLHVSKNAMRMVYALDDIAREVEQANACTSRLHAINRQTRYLALNAAIEAARAGGEAGAFQVIASEVRTLSNETESTVRTVCDRIGSIAENVKRSHAVLQAISTVDMSDHIMARDQLDALLRGIIAQNETFNRALSETASAQSALTGTITPLVMVLQFQDRVSQHLAHVMTAMRTLGDAGAELRAETVKAFPNLSGDARVGADPWIARLLEKQSLGAVRARFGAQLGEQLESEPAMPDAAHSGGGGADDGGVELF